MSARPLGPGDYRRMPWKNGGGTTTEIAAESVDGRCLWRASVADIERSGPFSDFAGYRRTLMLVEGEGLELAFEGPPGRRLTRRFDCVAFEGGWKCQARLVGGPVRALNLMVAAERAHATMTAIELAAPVPLPAADRTLLYGLTGIAAVAIDGRTYRIAPGEALRADDAAPMAAHAHEPHAALACLAIRFLERRP